MLTFIGRWVVVPIVLVTASSWLSRPAMAQQGGFGARGGQSQISAAMHNLAVAQRSVDVLTERAQTALSHDKDWVAAKDELALAEKNKDVVAEKVKQATMAKPEYKALEKQFKADTSDEQKADARMKMVNMVWNDQQNSTDYANARARVDLAQATVDAMWKSYEQQVLANDPEWRSCIAARDAARQEVSGAMAAQRFGGRSAGSGGFGRGGGGGRSSGGYGRGGGSGRASRY